MVGILKDLGGNFGAIGVRAEFEAEGTRLEELLRLKEISMKAGFGLSLKIGGCESVRDILEARTIGVNYLVAPMIESAYSLRKYLQAVDKFIPEQEKDGLEIHCNIETISAFSNLPEILKVPEIKSLAGVVIERVDLCFSRGLNDDCVDQAEIGQLVTAAVDRAKAAGLICTIGGGVSANSVPFFGSLGERLDRFETRKVCFDSRAALAAEPKAAIIKALGFELIWLKNKAGYKEGISAAEAKRAELLEKNYGAAIRRLIG